MHVSFPNGIPPSLLRTLEAMDARISHSWTEGLRTYLLVETEDRQLFARYSKAIADIPRLVFEAKLRALIGTASILRSPPVINQGEGWLLEHRTDTSPVEGPTAIEAVVEAALHLAELTLPTSVSNSPGGGFRRRARLLSSPLLAREAVLARRVFATLDLPLVTGHGDFHTGNVFFSQDAIWVIDWELCGRYPLGYDLMQLWSTLASPHDRELLMEGTFATFLEIDRESLLKLRYVLAVRAAASKLTALGSFDRDIDGARKLIALLPRLKAEARIGRR